MHGGVSIPWGSARERFAVPRLKLDWIDCRPRHGTHVIHHSSLFVEI